MTDLQPVLLSGGSGTRLWPLSREAYPKQFLALAGDDTMVQATWRRVAPLAGAAPIVVANEDHRFLVAEQLRQAGAPRAAILLEPAGRNTAPAIAAAALQAPADGADPLLLVLPVDIGWNDVGSWSALWEVSAQDGDGNAHHGDVIAVDSRNSYAWARRLVALVGVDDLVVVETDDAVLVAHKDKVQQVKEVVARLKADQRSHAVLHREVHRPWGSYDSIDQDEGFQVKRIKVKPGGRLSLQSHTRRAEHWIVVRGTARVTRDNDVFELHANQSTYIPLGAKHRLENPGDEVLELIEVQSGDYLGEDDIVRYEDVYGRS